MTARVPTCHPDRKYEALGLCRNCYDRARRADPEVAEREREQSRARCADPEVAERRREYVRARRADPAVAEREREQSRARRSDPAVAERKREYQRAYYLRKKVERARKAEAQE